MDELSETPRVDTASIPDFVRDNLAAATLDLIHSILRQPGGREMLDARTAARHAAAATKKGADKNGALLDLP